MAIQIGAKPDSGFDDPIGMLKDCHRRIERFLGILCVVVDRARGRSLTGEERDAVNAALVFLSFVIATVLAVLDSRVFVSESTVTLR